MGNALTIQGKYFSDVFLIEFPSHVSIFNREGTQGPKSAADFATFVHEYWHYLLNISTSRGYKDFALWQQLIPVFTHTLNLEESATSKGSDLNFPYRSHMERVLDIFFNYRGEGIQDSLGATLIDIEVTGPALIEDPGLTLGGIRVPYQRVTIPIIAHGNNQKSVISRYVLGNDAINESVANAVEKMVFDDGQIPPVDPYLILDRISRFYNKGTSLSKYEIAALGTLSYLSTDAAPSFIYLLEDYLVLRKNHSIRESLEILQQRFTPGFHQIYNTLIEDLQNLRSIYHRRQPLDRAIDLITGKYAEYFKLRSTNLLFDLRPFNPDTGKCNLNELEDLLFKIVPPCDVRQILHHDNGIDVIQKDLLQSFDVKPINLNGNIVESSYLMQVFHCAFRFFKAHWAFDSFIRSELSDDKCPYYSTCNLSSRVEKPDICAKKPWLLMSSSEENCMYGSAVAALLGHVTIKKKIES